MRGDEYGLTERVLDAVLEVSGTLGPGFPDRVYGRALLRELGRRGIRAVSQQAGESFANILVEDLLVVEPRCVDHLTDQHMLQSMNDLAACGRSMCLLVNFAGAKVEWKRIVPRLLGNQDHAAQNLPVLEV